ncbi:MAG TPA: tyrosinase family protein [Solirubrobacteraceae bacterium]|jgi:tyrosinase
MPQPRRVDPRPPAGRIRYRKSVGRLSARQGEWLRQAWGEVEKFSIADNRGFQFFAGLHGFPGGYCAHHRPGRPAPLFLPWHRAYLYFFELALQDQRPGVSLPWWDWSSARSHRDGLPPLFADERVGGAANPLFDAAIAPGHPGRQRGWPERTSRNPDVPASLPSQADVEDVLARPDFYDFSEALEGLHDGVHGWTGGTMGSVAFAAYDPIFWTHHTMIDRLWRLWQQRHGRGGPSVEDYDKALPPFPMTVRETLDVQRLGYDYAVSTTHVETP